MFSYHAIVFHRLVSTSPYALGGSIDTSCVVFFVFARNELLFVVGHTLFLGVYLYFNEDLRCTLAVAT